jgi:hypothetical protein
VVVVLVVIEILNLLNTGGGGSQRSLTFSSGTVYTITVGAGGSVSRYTNSGSNSSIIGTGLP